MWFETTPHATFVVQAHRQPTRTTRANEALDVNQATAQCAATLYLQRAHKVSCAFISLSVKFCPFFPLASAAVPDAWLAFTGQLRYSGAHWLGWESQFNIVFPTRSKMFIFQLSIAFPFLRLSFFISLIFFIQIKISHLTVAHWF